MSKQLWYVGDYYRSNPYHFYDHTRVMKVMDSNVNMLNWGQGMGDFGCWVPYN